MEHPEAVKREFPKETESYENLKISAKAERNKPKKPPTNPYTFENFKKPATCVLYLIGVIIWPKESYWVHKGCLVNFFIAILAINIDIACVAYNEASETTLLGITKYCAYTIYTILGEVKILVIFRNLSQINKLLKTFNSIFPVTKKQLAAYNIEEYYRKTVLLTLPPVFCVVSNVMFNTGSSFYRYFFIIDRTNTKEIGHILQYYPTYPFKVDTFWLYFAANFQQFHSALMVLFGVTGSEALLTFMVLQVCMHLNALSIRLDRHHCDRGDIKDLNIVVARHTLILRLMEDINDTFKVTTFITFLTSAFSICFGGFQIMYASDPVVFGNFLFFTLYDMLKLYVTSTLGDMLIQLSFQVGDSAYNTKWYENTTQYQKVIQLIINRSQKPANLNAITFHGACLVTFKEVCSKSYTFFTVLHTMYDG